MIRKIIYQAERQPTHFTMHALFAYITNKLTPQNYRVYISGHQIEILIDDTNIQLYLLDQYIFKSLGEMIVNKISDTPYTVINTYNNGDLVNVNGLLLYTCNLNNQEVSPVTCNNKIKQETRDLFLNYLQTNLGVDVKNGSLSVNKISRFEFDKPGYLEFNSIMKIDINGRVIDSNKINALQYKAIGRKKSFGFGNFNVRLIDE